MVDGPGLLAGVGEDVVHRGEVRERLGVLAVLDGVAECDGFFEDGYLQERWALAKEVHCELVGVVAVAGGGQLGSRNPGHTGQLRTSSAPDRGEYQSEPWERGSRRGPG